MLILLFETKYSRMNQVKFVEDILQKVLLGPFLDLLPDLFQCFLVFSEAATGGVL